MGNVKNQPFLTGFPRQLFGSNRRPAQERMRAARDSLLGRTLSGLALMFEGVLGAEAMEGLSGTRRHRVYDQVTTFWAWLGQVLERNESCAQAVTKVQAGRVEAGLPLPSGNTAAYCTARAELPGGLLQQVEAMVRGAMEKRVGAAQRWKGLVPKAIDGSSVRLMDTPANQARYPQPPGQRPGCGFPVMGVTAVLNLTHGGWEAMATGPWKDHDLRGAMRLLGHFGPGDLVLADRAYNSFALMALLLQRGAHSLMRLNQQRAKKLDWSKGRRIGRRQRIFVWSKPRYEADGLLGLEQWAALPDSLVVRLIRTTIRDRTGRKTTLVVATTLLDEHTHGGMELLELYARRWEIELRLRDVKTTLGMEAFHVRTPEMAHKCLLMVRIAYNLLKWLVQAAAHGNAPAQREVSFKGTLDAVLAFEARYRGRQRHHRLRHRIHAQLIETVADKILDIRPGRHQPRAVKLRPKAYQLLTAPRSVFRETPRKSRYRKTA